MFTSSALSQKSQSFKNMATNDLYIFKSDINELPLYTRNQCGIRMQCKINNIKESSTHKKQLIKNLKSYHSETEQLQLVLKECINIMEDELKIQKLLQE
ncbi:hypothetical protein SS50377_21058 [Spironucleus salmonicida]|uniref:Uncharacterized protein n=1 Tax=Spironucleus salmonicida TaxID=348837 RepID=V6LGP9_9EUKA|nr:hypothetical protein SS50377_21058 [Spironucleus salmonicida]|eukprot:EST43715.1 Hypothetical protein SS50377_16769 [Spironucleus salmonicida]